MKNTGTDSGTEGTGNTNTVPKKKFRAYALTIFNKEERNILMSMKYRYIIIGKEKCPSTNRKHYQCYIYFKNPISFKKLKTELPTAHIEVSKGNAKQNKQYCSKESVYFEDGDIPHQGCSISIEDLREMTNEEIIEMDPRCHRAYINARELLNNDIDIDDWNKNVRVIYIQGPSGCGKTNLAKSIAKENKDKYGNKVNIISYENGFYMGLGSAKIAIYDEWRDSHMKPSEFIKLIDYNKHMMNIKGGNKRNDYELIIITTIQKIKSIYNNCRHIEAKKQWMRRIEVINMYTSNNEEEEE